MIHVFYCETIDMYLLQSTNFRNSDADQLLDGLLQKKITSLYLANLSATSKMRHKVKF